MPRILPILLFVLPVLFAPALAAQKNIFAYDRQQAIDVTRSGPAFMNFRFGKPIRGIYGLQDTTYTTTIEGTSILQLDGENIGQVVIYARLLSATDTSIFADNPALSGTLTLTPVVNGRALESARGVYEFSGANAYRQIYHITQTEDVERVTATFDSRNGFFIVDRVEVIPYTDFGVENLRNRRKYNNQLLTRPARHAQLRRGYTEELQRIEDYHKVLNELIGREESAALARLKTRGFNPFESAEFLAYFNDLQERADKSERAKLSKVRADISKFNFQEVALSVDNLLLGGKFTALIGLVDQVFNETLKVTDSGGDPQPIVQLDGQNYVRNDKRNKVQLLPISDETLNQRVTALRKRNEQYQTYIDILQRLTGQDLELQNKINQDIQTAKDLRAELERLEWEILEDFTDRPRAEFIDDHQINFTQAYAEFDRSFPELDATELDFLDRQELRLRAVRSNLRTLRTTYQQLIGDLKTHYDNLYQNYPQDRIGAFAELNLLPPTIAKNWNDNQREILVTYRGSSLVRLLESALASL
jgi:hypothetical protein